MTTATHAPTRVGFHEFSTAVLVPSTLNPRKRVSHLDELAASIREVGVIEPLLVRPTVMTTDDDETVYEVVAGSRRLAAAQLAGALTVPVHVRELTDAQALELAIVENNQRGDVHPLEEAAAFVALKRLDRAYTPEVIATKIGRPLAYVRNRLRLLDLGEDAREAFSEDRITIGHAERIARLPLERQTAALAACFSPLYGHDTDEEMLRPVQALDEWITTHTVIDVRSAHVQEALPELVEQVERAEAEGATLVQLSTGQRPAHGLKGKAAPLPMNVWRQVGPKACSHVTQGVVVYGERDRAQILTVCLKKSKCPTHWPPPPEKSSTAAPPPTWKQREEERRQEQAAWEAQQPAVLKALAAHFKGRKADVALGHVVLGAMGQEANDVHEHIGKLTPQNIGQVLWFAQALQCRMWDRADWAREVKSLFGFDLAKWEKAQAKAGDKSTTVPPAKAAKKTAKKR
jgi:ParB/RepB/Spo0J family partition protein